MNWRRFPALVLLAAVAGCSGYPKDVEGTSEQVRGGAMQVGMISSPAGEMRSGQRLVEALAQEMSSRPRVEIGAAEPLLLRLEKGELDLVVGTFAADSPWSTRATFSKPLLPAASPDQDSKAAVRLGEHRWSMIVDGAVSRLNKQAGQ